MKTFAFINYRRSDAQQAAHGLYAQMRARFGPSHVFMDVNALLPGALWPDRLRRALEEATVLLCIIGPRWLTTADRYGQRRLDKSDDWVRNEIIHALNCQKPIIPILVAGGEVPPIEGLPTELSELLLHQAVQLRDEKWDQDLNELVRTLESEHGFVDNEKSVVLPQREVRIAPLDEAQLDAALSTLNGWQPVESMVPGDYPNSRQELRKAYRFRSFKAAIQFMGAAVNLINKIPHHPRWENQWRTVTVYFTTWDIGNKISELDIKLARTLDELYQDFDAEPKE